MHESLYLGLLNYLNAPLLLQAFGPADDNLDVYVANGKFKFFHTGNRATRRLIMHLRSLRQFVWVEKSLRSRLRLLIAIFGYS